MTIMHTIETGGPGGAEQMLLRLAEAYGARGYRQMVCLRKDGWLADQVRSRGIDLEIFPQGRMVDIRWLRRVKSLAQHYGVDAIHSHEYSMNVHAALLGRWLGVPTVATVHGKAYYHERLSRRLAYRAVARLSNMVAVSHDIRKHLIEIVGIAPGSVQVIINGIDKNRYLHSASGRRDMRARLGVDDSEILIGAMGSYYPVKGHKYLVEAMSYLLPQCPSTRLVIAGQGPLASELRDYATQLAISEKVDICGYLDNVPALLSALDIFVLPSLSEGMPLALLEAAATARPIVASRVGGIPEIIGDGGGVLVAPADAVELSEALAGLVTDAERRSALGIDAQEIAGRWSFEMTVDSYLQLVELNGAAQ